MKLINIIITIVGLLFISSCSTSNGNTTEKVSSITVKQTEKTYQLKGFKSSCCTGIVNYSLKEVDGYLGMQPNLESSSVTVWFDNSKASEKEIIDAINQTPYKVKQ
ncbi:heavy-metal-associated domain-containing protein [Flammeovirga agarivorans]|uniref:Heavy-metal-associated domain-containing protein n=1 Tax=Flammeovirga agarivorans TaxID=2726742 RepID=A0A7X8SII2_9BACT|nr:heavy-metal-associated domain-containing protein [Flammeovirga agarivorans]NLR90816.1 heavy-metal-associated domain-containing protein [Flammeovirga agarivorans]